MKVFRVITTALATLCACATIPAGSVFAAADAQPTVYPDNFEHRLAFNSPICDYAISGDTLAFAYNTTICILSPDSSGEVKHTDYMHEAPVSRLDCDEEGNLYFMETGNAGNSGKTYLYSSEITEAAHEFQSVTTFNLAVKEGVFYTLEKTEGELDYWNDGVRTNVGNGFSLLKKYGGGIYAVKDNLPYKIEGDKYTALDLSYTDYSDADNIYTGTAKTALSAGNYSVKTAIVKSGAYCTQIDISRIDEKFKQIYTQKTSGEKPCLVLCESGNASIIATNNGCFLTATGNLTEYPYVAPVNDWKINSHGVRAAYAIDSAGVYSMPFISDSTRIATLKSGSENPVTVTEKFYLDFLSTAFYRVSYEEEITDEKTGETQKRTVNGFVAANFLTEYDFAADDNKPVDSGDKEFKYDTNVTSVILAIIIVGLVIIAILYVTLVGSKKDGKPKKKEKKKRRAEENSDDSD